VATLTLLLAPWLGVARGLWVGSAASAQESPDAGLIVELEFAGDDDAVELPLESVDPISLTFIDIADPRVLLNVINGCDLNDRFWVFAANLSDTPATLTITATERGSSRTFSLPAREPSQPADAIVGLGRCRSVVTLMAPRLASAPSKARLTTPAWRRVIATS
jgi:hypothetical protein